MSARPHVIVLGNEKGGSGKSTTAMHLFVALARQGKKIGAVDLDSRQQSFFRYLDNRNAYNERQKTTLAMPMLAAIEPSDAPLRADAAQQDRHNLAETIVFLGKSCDFIIIDTPGAVTTLSEAAHASADTLITPMNDSLIDFDLLGRMDPVTGKVAGPSVYSELVWSCRQRRAAEGKQPTDWVVLRNRMATLESRNKTARRQRIDRIEQPNRVPRDPRFLGTRHLSRIVPERSDASGSEAGRTDQLHDEPRGRAPGTARHDKGARSARNRQLLTGEGRMPCASP